MRSMSCSILGRLQWRLIVRDATLDMTLLVGECSVTAPRSISPFLAFVIVIFSSVISQSLCQLIIIMPSHFTYNTTTCTLFSGKWQNTPDKTQVLMTSTQSCDNQQQWWRWWLPQLHCIQLKKPVWASEHLTSTGGLGRLVSSDCVYSQHVVLFIVWPYSMNIAIYNQFHSVTHPFDSTCMNNEQ